jgi:hypothetical protein
MSSSFLSHYVIHAGYFFINNWVFPMYISQQRYWGNTPRNLHVTKLYNKPKLNFHLKIYHAQEQSHRLCFSLNHGCSGSCKLVKDKPRPILTQNWLFWNQIGSKYEVNYWNHHEKNPTDETNRTWAWTKRKITFAWVALMRLLFMLLSSLLEAQEHHRELLMGSF